MPEGPSIVLLKEELAGFKGKKVIGVSGNAKIDLTRIKNKKVTDLKSWGKHFLICFNGFFLRVHMLMWGTYRVNEKKDTAPRLSLVFKNGEVNFYSCSIKMIEGDPSDIYDWQTDVMSEEWNASKVTKKLKAEKNSPVCDCLLDQETFTGVGNIIKNEVLFRIKVHPASIVSCLPPAKLRELVKEGHDYSWDFYKWKKKFELKKHWLIYKKKMCPRCNIKPTITYMGKHERLTYYCANCQVMYPEKMKSTKRKAKAK
ncbi:MAG: DNA-formamidopyrimidine glycosylase family protein [Bacteroidia bacterium]